MVTETSEYLRVNGLVVRRNPSAGNHTTTGASKSPSSVQKNEGDKRAPGVRAASLVSWIGEGNAWWLNGSAAVRANPRRSSVSAWQRALTSLALAARPPAVAWRHASPARPTATLIERGGRAWGSANPSPESRPAEPGAPADERAHVSHRRLQILIRSIVLSPREGEG